MTVAQVAGLVGLASLPSVLVVVCLVGGLLWRRQRSTRRQPHFTAVVATRAQRRWRKTHESDRDPETTEVIRAR